MPGPAFPRQARPKDLEARRLSFLAWAAEQSSVQGRPFLRIGRMAVAPRSMMAVWRRVSKAPSAVTVPICSLRGICSSPWDLIEKVRPHRAVALAAGCDLHRADVPGDRVHGEVHLAPLPPAARTVPADLPLALAPHLHARAVDQQVQGAGCAAERDLEGDCSTSSGPTGATVLSHSAAGTGWSSPAPASPRRPPASAGARPSRSPAAGLSRTGP